MAKSLNELYSESSSSSAFLPPPPPPSAIRAGALLMQTQTLPRPPQQFSDSPQGFPLTRSVSTTTDIYATQNASFSGTTLTKADNNRKRNVATNTRHNNDTETQTNGNGGGGGSVGANNQQKAQLQQRGNNNTQSKKTLPQQLQQQNQRHKNNKNFAANDDDNDLLNNSIDKHHQQYRQHNNHHTPHSQRTPVNGNNQDNNDNFNHNHNDDDIEDVDEEQPQKLCGLKRTIRKTKDELFEEFCKRAGVRPKPKNIYYIENHEGEEENDDIYNDNDDNDNILTVSDNNATTQHSVAIEDEEMLPKPLRLNNVRSSNLLQRRSEAQGNHLMQQQMQQQLQKQHSLEYRRSVGGMENNRMYGDAVDVVDIDDDVDENGFKKLTENEDHLYVIDGK